MATIDGGGKKRKTANQLLTTPPTGEQVTNGATNTSGAKSPNFSDMTPEEIVAIVVNTAVVAKRQMAQMVVANYSGNTPGIVVQIPGWHVVNGEVKAVAK